MKNTTYNFNKRQRVFSAFLIVSVITGISFLINHPIQAESKKNSPPIQNNNSALKSFVARSNSAPAANIGERTSVWLNLQTGKSPDTTFYGNDQAIFALQSDLAEPISQTSADFNSDGYNDLISGFRNAAGGGLIALHRASRQAFEPTDEKVLADLRQGVFPAAFEKDALILDVPTAPDFIFAGKFTQDSAVDLVFASRGGRVIYLMTSNGTGGFNAPQEIAVGGEITALAAERLNIKISNYIGVIAAVRGRKSSFITVFDGSAELGKTAPRNLKIEGNVTSLILAGAYGGAVSRDVFGLADGDVFTIRGIDTRNASVNKIELPFKSTGIAVGEFIADRQARAEIAVLADNGSVAYLTHGTLDTRPFTAEEMEAFYATHERGADSPVEPVTDAPASDKWQISEERQLGVYATGGDSSPVLQKARLTGNETEDLLVTDSADREVKILFKEPNRDKNRTAFTGETKSQVVSFADAPAGVLPMRLNVTGQQGFVYFSKGSSEPVAIMAAPNATFTVTKTADTNDGACNADCSLREAIIAANAASGADMISLPAGTYTLTIAGIEDAAAQGDLDVTDGLTITGTGAANTIIQAGTTTAAGIDKVFSINPALTTAFATSFSGLTIRNGNAPTTGNGRFGGAMDWDGRASGTLTFSGVTVTANQTADSNGGGIFTSGTAGSDLVTFTNSILSNNTSRRANATTSANGGGFFTGANVSLQMTGTTVSGNTAGSPNVGNGGGVFLQITPSSAGRPVFTNSTISGNTTVNQGGGIFTQQPIDINPVSIISNNAQTSNLAGSGGGGIYIIGAGNTNISKATMVGNSSGRSGGAIFLDNAGGNPTLNMTFSRIVENSAATSFSGVAVEDASASASVENNFWGCNTGPNTAGCDSVGTISTGSFDFNPWLRYTHTASPTSIVVGQSTTLTASFLTNSDGTAIAASNLNVLIGLPITFNNAVRGTISNAQATIQSNGTATATFTGTSSGAGSANAKVDNGTATATVTIAQAATTTAVTSNANPSVFGQTVTLTATVSVTAPGGGTPTGTVQFRDGGTAIAGCTAVAVSGGTAQCVTNALAVGSHTITAVYSGDANFTGSTSPNLTQTINRANTTTTINSNTPNPSNQNTAVTVTFSVAVNSPGAGTPTGTVTVSDGVNSCTASVATGSCMITLTTSGMRTLTATYSGDANFNTSTSAGVSQTVAPPTAAPVEVGGRVMTNTGRGISGARVTITDSTGNSRSATTSAFGYFRFADVQAGETYIVSVKAKRYRFAEQVLSITGNLTDLNFTAH